MRIIPEYLYPAFQGVFPSAITTCSAEGEPNTTYISQVYYVDEDHVALSYQFFGKTTRNIKENPNVAAVITHPETLALYRLNLRFVRRETEGDLFEQMDMQLDALASIQGMEKIFKLKGADIYRVKHIVKIDDWDLFS